MGNRKGLDVIEDKQFGVGLSPAEFERLAQSAIKGAWAALDVGHAKREIARRAIDRARDEGREGDDIVDALVQALEILMTFNGPSGSAAEGERPVADRSDFIWKLAFGCARDVVELKLQELPSDAKPAERALLQVYDELSRARTVHYQAYKVPQKLNRHRPRRARPQALSLELQTRREVILAALPEAGSKAKRSDITRLLLDKGMAASASSAGNAIKALMREGVLFEERVAGGRMLVRESITSKKAS